MDISTRLLSQDNSSVSLRASGPPAGNDCRRSQRPTAPGNVCQKFQSASTLSLCDVLSPIRCAASVDLRNHRSMRSLIRRLVRSLTPWEAPRNHKQEVTAQLHQMNLADPLQTVMDRNSIGMTFGISKNEQGQPCVKTQRNRIYTFAALMNEVNSSARRREP